MKKIKKLVLAVWMITGSLALAQATGGGGSTGGGLSSHSHPNPRGCKEGRRIAFYETLEGEDRQTLVVRTCRNGSYYDLSDYIYDPKVQCRGEGRVVYMPQRDSDERIPLVCYQGIWREL